ncbi:MAG: hypothetical protein P8H52_01980 [Porticoccaceae bacterium]|nr:hypothetical protein [Porticoccaceae bacterium]MDG1782334.1 hypothetical protein [Porticoccaceae bacterium]
MDGSKHREEYDHLSQRPFCCAASAMAKLRLDLDENAAGLKRGD